MTKEEFIALYEKCLTGHCSIEELHLLEKYQDDYELTKRKWLPEMGDREEVKRQILTNLRSQIRPVAKVSRFLYWHWAIAASIVVFLSVGIAFLMRTKKQVTGANDVAKVLVPKKAIVPGSNKAILILANGNKIDLDGYSKGLVSKQGAASITKLSNGKLVYHAAPLDQKENTVAYNTISTPRGGQYQLTLADGTTVWLNAASSLKYPTSFPGKERTVELTGEAYFEVAKNKNMPFKVLANGVSVHVLGTHFNVMAYQDENSTQTTLLEGSVRLMKDNQEAMLVPGEQGVVRNGATSFEVREVNVNEIVAWKNGLFTFNNENIHTIMRKVSRWYDVDIEYEGNLVKQNFGGSVSRFKDISNLLKTLELTGTIHFKIDGRRITVMP